MKLNSKPVIITGALIAVGLVGYFYWKTTQTAKATAEQLATAEAEKAEAEKNEAAAERELALTQKAKNDALRKVAATDATAKAQLEAAQSDANIQGAFVYTNAIIPLRADKYPTSTIITYLAKGMKVRVIEPYKDMYNVYYNSAKLGGRQQGGWVLKNQVTLI